jgi:hypothetical protein
MHINGIHRLVSRYLSLVLAMFFPAALLSQTTSDRTASNEQKIQVFIIGVPKWHLEDLQHSDLSAGITDACHEIVRFFRARFSDPGLLEFHPKVDQMCTEKFSTYERITHMLKVELPSSGKQTLTFLFMMSHGQTVNTSNKAVRQDLRFISSDMTNDTVDDKSILIGRDLIPWLNQMPSGSTVIAFIDTCNSGSVDSLQLRLVETLQKQYGLRFGLVASSMSGEKTYNANFTRSLLKFWQTHPCPSEKFEDWIHANVASETKLVDLKGFEGYPQVIVPYADGEDWCLNALSSHGKLLFLYQGATDPVRWTIARKETGDDFPKPRTRLVANTSFSLELVPAGHYTITALTPENRSVQFGPLDLTSTSTAPVFLSTPKSPIEVTKAFESWRNYAAYKGIPDRELKLIDKRVELAMAIQSPEDPWVCNVHDGRCEPTKGSDPNDPEEWLPRVVGKPDSSQRVGEYALNSHNFTYAVKAFGQAASASDDKNFRNDNALAAYVVACVRGDAKTADEIRIHFNLNLEGEYRELGNAVDRARETDTFRSREELKAAGAVKLLTSQYHLIADEQR